MTSADILVCMVELDPDAASTALFRRPGIPRFRLTDLSPDTMQRTIAGMCRAQFLVPPVNDVPGSLRIEAR